MAEIGHRLPSLLVTPALRLQFHLWQMAMEQSLFPFPVFEVCTRGSFTIHNDSSTSLLTHTVHAHTLDGERCAATLKSIFENAKNPDKVVVGLIESVAPDDILCLEAYCKENGKQHLWCVYVCVSLSRQAYRNTIPYSFKHS